MGRSSCLLSLVFSSLLIFLLVTPHLSWAHPAPKEPPASVPSLSFGHIILRTTTLLPSEDQAAIESMLRWKMSALATPGDPEMQQLAHDLVREAYQDHGYFKVNVSGPAVQMRGRKLFDRGLPRRLRLTRNVTSPSGYLLLDFQVGS